MNNASYQEIIALLKCPVCSGKLTEKKDRSITCLSCSFSSGTDLLPSFLKSTSKDFHPSYIPTRVVRRFVKSARVHGVEKALKMDFFKEYNNWFTKYIFDYSRADWRFLLPMDTKDKVLLEIGCGYGTLSVPLSEMFKSVISLDIALEHLEVLDIRRRDLGIKNIFPIRADASELPIKDSAVDVVVLMGVLEWTGDSVPNIKVSDLHRKILARTNTILKKGGYLVLGIENRFGYNYFLGERDEHSHIKYTTLLPRFLANIVSKNKRDMPYRTHTYSYGGYKKLLKEAGFGETEFFGAVPKYRYPNSVIELKNKIASEYHLNKSSSSRARSFLGYILRSVISKLGLYKYITPTFIIMAKK